MMIRPLPVAAILLGALTPARADPTAITVRAAWSPPAARGDDTKLFMKVANAGAADAIIRVRCAAANFTEFRQVDHGEGFPSARAVKAIPLAMGETQLGPDENHIVLLQLTRPLVAGETFDCTLRLRDGGSKEIPVAVRPLEQE